MERLCPVDKVEQKPRVVGNREIWPLLCLHLLHLPLAFVGEGENKCPAYDLYPCLKSCSVPDVVGPLVGGSHMLHFADPTQLQHRSQGLPTLRRLVSCLQHLRPVLVSLSLLLLHQTSHHDDHSDLSYVSVFLAKDIVASSPVPE